MLHNDMFSATYSKPSVIQINAVGGEEAWLEKPICQSLGSAS